MSLEHGAVERVKSGPARILLVEDDPGDIYLFEKALKDRGIDYELTCFEDGEAAIQNLDAGLNADLILVDLNLPRKDGFDVLHAIRNTPAFVDVPVGVFTSSQAQADKARASLLGANRYIHKSPELEEFLNDVGTAVQELLRR